VQCPLTDGLAAKIFQPLQFLHGGAGPERPGAVKGNAVFQARRPPFTARTDLKSWDMEEGKDNFQPARERVLYDALRLEHSLNFTYR
jgi:hypothetical protein